MHLLKIWPFVLLPSLGTAKTWWGSGIISALLGSMSRDTTKDAILASYISQGKGGDLGVDAHCQLLALQLRAARTHASTLTSAASRICAQIEKERIRFGGDTVEMSLNDTPKLQSTFSGRRSFLLNVVERTSDLATLIYIRSQLEALRWLQNHSSENIESTLRFTPGHEYIQLITSAVRNYKARSELDGYPAFGELAAAKKTLLTDPANKDAFERGVYAIFELNIQEVFDAENRIATQQGLHLY